MEIIFNQNTIRKNAFTAIRGGKQNSDSLHEGEKALLGQMSQILTVITGGDIRNRRGHSA